MTLRILYRLFGDKEGLLDAVAEYGFASYLAAKPVPQPGADPVEDLRAGWDLHISFGLDHPALFLLMYGEPRPGHRSPAAVAGFKVLQARVHRIAAAGRLRVSERLAADMVHAAGCGAVMTLLAAPEALRPPGLSDAMFDAIVAAIATSEPGPQAAGPVAVANALRAEIPGLTMLSDGERHVPGGVARPHRHRHRVRIWVVSANGSSPRWAARMPVPSGEAA